MSKAVLIPIWPKWCELIASGKKTVEVRKTRPKLETPFKCYIYETRGFERVGNDSLNCVIGGSGRGMVVAEFVCDSIYPLSFYASDTSFFDAEPPFPVPGTCLTDKEIVEYLGNGKTGFGWRISNLVIYDEPKKLSEFTGLRKTKFGYAPYEITRPPQSLCYVEEE